jgi:hypothetical protein
MWHAKISVISETITAGAPMTSTQSTILSSTKTRQKTWLLVAMLLALIGLGISSYSTIHHLEVKAK